jgi:hypothetical protein
MALKEVALRCHVWGLDNTLRVMDTWIKAILTLSILAISLFGLVKGKDPKLREYAMWLLGALMGYWLR